MLSSHRCLGRASCQGSLPSLPCRSFRTAPSRHFASGASDGIGHPQRQHVLDLRFRAAASSGAGPGSNSAFDIVFGKPSAPKELYEKIARDSRAAMMAQVEQGEQMDVVLAALHLCAEDDAIKTRTHIPLPVDAFSARLDNMVSECSGLMPQGLGAEEQLAFATEYLYGRWGLKIAKGMSDGEYSPYRVYINNVLTQRCGTPCSSASLLSAFLLRLRRAGALSALVSEPSIGLPAAPGANPVAAVAGTEESHGPLVRWVSKVELLAEMLDQLKRFYWSWDWPLGAASGFDACARALLGESGRAGLVNAAVGVMQPKGRPFGDVGLSVLATERQALVTRAVDNDSWAHAIQVRDLGALNLHIGKRAEGLALMDSYQAWLHGKGQLLGPTGAAAAASTSTATSSQSSGGSSGDEADPIAVERCSAPGAYATLVAEVLLVQRKKALEMTYSGEGGDQGPIEVMPADD